MTETIAVALISNLTTIIVVILSRLWSHREHRRTETKITELQETVNGSTKEE